MKEATEQFLQKIRVLPGSTLKWIALISMIIDHLAAALLLPCMNAGIYGSLDYETWEIIYRVMRNIGRTAFPIYCFLLVEGYHYTKNKGKYLRNLAIFALISEIPFNMAFQIRVWDASYQNVFLNLLISLLTMMLVDLCREKFHADERKGLVESLCWILPTVLGGIVAYLTLSDYYFFGTILVVVLYKLYHNRLLQGVAGYLVFLFEPWCFPAFILIQMYNGKRGRQYKYFFYAAYPVHLLIIVAIRYFVFGIGVTL
ncbi:MAG: conjugal transfer protein TraX [Lachnospiraceae bacterium]|nr:conjugal transfer protein TraX [Lachnospiraceae bacterium]